MFRTTLIAASLTAIAACSSVPLVGDDGDDDFGSQIADIADDWKDGKKDVERGRKMIEKGRDDVADGRRKIDRHEDRLRSAERDLTRAREAYNAALLLASANAAPGTRVDPNEDETLKRLDDRVDDLEDDVKDNRGEIEEGRKEIRHGERQIQRGEELIKNGERAMIEAEAAYRSSGGSDEGFFNGLF